MKQLLLPVFKGEIEYIGNIYIQSECILFEEYAKELFPENDNVNNFYNPTSIYFCVTQFTVYRVNQKLKEGKVLIGSDGNNWIFTDKKNIKEQ